MTKAKKSKSLKTIKDTNTDPKELHKSIKLVVKQILDLDIVQEFFLNDVKLFNNCMQDEDLLLRHLDEWYPEVTSRYIGYYENDKLISIMKCDTLTNIAQGLHHYLASSEWGKGKAEDICRLQIAEIIKITNCFKLVVQTPDKCKNVMKVADNLGFTIEGYIKRSSIWRGELVGLFIMGTTADKELKR